MFCYVRQCLQMYLISRKLRGMHDGSYLCYVILFLPRCDHALLLCSCNLLSCLASGSPTPARLSRLLVALDLKAELGRLCPFSAPRGHTFSTCPPRFPPRVFHGQIFTPDKHKVSAPNAPHQKVIQIIRPRKN